MLERIHVDALHGDSEWVLVRFDGWGGILGMETCTVARILKNRVVFRTSRGEVAYLVRNERLTAIERGEASRGYTPHRAWYHPESAELDELLHEHRTARALVALRTQFKACLDRGSHLQLAEVQDLRTALDTWTQLRAQQDARAAQ